MITEQDAIDCDVGVVTPVVVLIEFADMRANVRQILTFLVLVFAFSSFPYALVILTGHLGMGSGLVVRLLMWCPALAALTTCALLRIDVGTLGWKWRPVKWVALGYVLPFFYAVPVYVFCWVTVKGSFGFESFAGKLATSYRLPQWPHAVVFALAVALLGSVGLIGSVANALGEEIGWRGFLLLRLVGQFGFTVGCLVSGCIWAVWHYPLLLFADYNSGTDKRFALACFTLMVIGNAFLMGWLRMKSGSLWPCALLHASHNLWIQAIFDGLTAPVGRALYITTEFGAGW